MKRSAILLSVILLYASSVFGQVATIKINAVKNDSTYFLNNHDHQTHLTIDTATGITKQPDWYYKPRHSGKRCDLYKAGEGFFLPGIIAFVPIVIVGYLNTPSTHDASTPPVYITAIGIDVGFIAIGGGLMYIGHLYEKNHTTRLSLTGKGNQLGLAYNF